MNFDLCKAIKNKEVIEFHYDGGVRIVEPFCFGESTKGNLVLRGFQIDGYSSSGTPTGWRLYKTDEMSQVRRTNSHFTGIRPHYNPNDKGMQRIICNI